MKARADRTGLKEYMRKAIRYPLLDRDEELELAKAVRQGSRSAASRLVECNLRFVVKVALQYQGYDVRIMDLVQEGNVGLIMAVQKFDPERGFRLVSYAIWWIKAYMHSFITRSSSLVKIGTTQAQRKLFFRLRSERERADRLAEFGERASIEVIAQALGVSESDVHEMEQRLSGCHASLDAKLSDASVTSLLDFLVDDTFSSDELCSELSITRDLRVALESNAARLCDREREILNRRLLSDEPSTLVALGRRFNVSRERVRQIESNVVRKLRSVMARHLPDDKVA